MYTTTCVMYTMLYMGHMLSRWWNGGQATNFVLFVNLWTYFTGQNELTVYRRKHLFKNTLTHSIPSYMFWFSQTPQRNSDEQSNFDHAKCLWSNYWTKLWFNIYNVYIIFKYISSECVYDQITGQNFDLLYTMFILFSKLINLIWMCLWSNNRTKLWFIIYNVYIVFKYLSSECVYA